MKKIHITLIALLGLMSMGTANAAYPDLAAGKNTITLLDCSQLANDIQIVMSSNVVGTIDCDTDAVYVGLSVCHETGLTTERSVSEAPVDATNGTCSDAALSYDGTNCVGVITGSKFPTATTYAGTVASRYPGSDCTLGNTATEAAGAIADALQ